MDSFFNYQYHIEPLNPLERIIYAKAGAYFAEHSKSSLEFAKVLNVLSCYYSIKEKGKKITFRDLGELAGVGTMTARKIVISSGESSFYHSCKNHTKNRHSFSKD